MRDFFVRLSYTSSQSLEYNVASAHSPATDPSYPDPTQKNLSKSSVTLYSWHCTRDQLYTCMCVCVCALRCSFYQSILTSWPRWERINKIKIPNAAAYLHIQHHCMYNSAENLCYVEQSIVVRITVKLFFLLLLPPTPHLPKRTLSNKVNRQQLGIVAYQS